MALRRIVNLVIKPPRYDWQNLMFSRYSSLRPRQTKLTWGSHPCWYFAQRSYCEGPKYFMGKRIVEEVDDPFSLEYLLLTIQGYDEAVVESYLAFTQTAANLVNVNLTKYFNMPAIKTHYRTRNDPRDGQTFKEEYTLKKYQRIVEFQNVTEDKCDILIQYLREGMPCGVDIKLELKRWEEIVAPGHPALRKPENRGYTGKN